MKWMAFIIMAVFVYGDDGFLWNHKGVETTFDKVYIDNCKECHFPYQAGLLPASSWQKMLEANALSNHFQTDASIDEEDRVYLVDYLTRHAADNSWYKKSRKIAYSLQGKTELRISQVPYITTIHKKVDKKYFTSPKVKSASYCDRCHQSAKDGVYEEDDVYIPDYGRWTD